jgi:uncharacterized DUF497 family protein
VKTAVTLKHNNSKRGKPRALLLFFWPDENTEHVAEHGVTPEEIEEVTCDPDFVEHSRSSTRLIAFGATSTGK